jgi:hypothetical protein
MADFDVKALKEMQDWANFGRAVIEMAKSAGIVPKRQIVRTKTVERIKVVTRRPRRTKAEMVATRALESAKRDEGTEGPGSGEVAPTGSVGALDSLIK